MKRYILSIMTIVILIASIASVTHAWFTYVERKSLASIQTGTISITTRINGSIIVDQIDLFDLAYLDYQKDLINDQSQTFDVMVSKVVIEIINDNESPLSRSLVTIDDDGNPECLFYVVILEGINIGATPLTTTYHDLVSGIIAGHSSIAEAKSMIDAYNTDALDAIYQTVMSTSDILTFQIAYFGLYDLVNDPEGYLNLNYQLTLTIDTVNAKGAIAP